jgi:TonB family protein
MMEFLIYDLKVAVLVAVFYMFYRLLLSRETFHRTNRLVLLATAVASFILPLCVITLHKTVVVSGTGMVSFDGLGMAEAVDAAEPQMPLWQIIAIVAFFAGMAVTLGHTLVGILKVWRLIRHSERHQESDGIIICVTDHDVSPFSFCRYIVLSRSDYEANEASVLAHERGHIHQRHSLDVLLVDTLTALQWFNPAMWMLRQDLRAIHEYEADAAVLSQGINMRQYQYLLIQKAVATCGYSVANGITHSTLKNRIHMMLTNKKTNSASWMKLLAMLPIVGAALALNAETVNDYVYAEKPQTQQKKVVKKGRKDGQIKLNNKTIEVKAVEAKDKAEAAEKEEVAIGVYEPNEKQNSNSTIEELVKRLPGASVDEEGNITINGKKVQKIMVDGNKIVLPDKKDGKEPLIVIDGKVATREQMQALDHNTIDHINTINESKKDILKVYANRYNADTSNGIIFINTKEFAKNGKKEPVVVVVAKKPQEEENEPQGVFDVVENMPEYPGGAPEMMKFLATNVKYPDEAFSKGIEGRVILTFIVEKDGSISNVKVVKSVNETLDAEAVRVVEMMPKWKPGKQNGRDVRVKYTIPVAFRLS